MVYRCLFEQSGHFKNEFKKLGYAALDYDILNDFGETDFQIDLYNEINKAYDGGGAYLILLKKKMLFLLSSLALDLNTKFKCGIEEMDSLKKNGVMKKNCFIL